MDENQARCIPSGHAKVGRLDLLTRGCAIRHDIPFEVGTVFTAWSGDMRRTSGDTTYRTKNTARAQGPFFWGFIWDVYNSFHDPDIRNKVRKRIREDNDAH
eukprot:2276386-Pyramimonas_sp.AAC.1